MFESVVLPAPFSPSSACTSPAAASKSTLSFATTPGKRFVTPRSATAVSIAGVTGGEALSTSPPERSAFGTADHALHEPVHRVQLLDRELLTLLDAQHALLVVQRTRELVELVAEQRSLLCGDRPSRLRGHFLAVRCEPDEMVVEAAVVEDRLPGAVHRGLHPAQVVRPPVVDRSRQPLLRGKRLGIRVVPNPRDSLRLCVLSGRRAVDVLPQDVGACGDERLRGLLLLAQVEPRVRPDQTDLRS